MSREVSSSESGWVMALIEPSLEIIVGKGNVTMHLVRKLAHFTEYFVLGAELTLYVDLRARRTSAPQTIIIKVLPLVIGLITASLDETIQIFSGREPAVTDVLLDFCGVLTAFIIVRIILAIWSKRQ